MKQYRIQKLWAVALVLIGCLTSLATHAAAESSTASVNVIEKVEVSGISGQTLVKVTLRQPMAAVPSSFTVSSPPRVAFDFLDTENASGASVHKAALSDLQSINVVQAGTRTRLVLNLNRASQYDARLEGRVLYISLGGQMPVSASAVSPQNFKKPAATTLSEGNRVQNVDFRAESLDVAVLKIDLSDPNPLIDVKRQGSSLVLLLQNVKIPDRLSRRLDVRDFGTPVTSASASAYGQSTQVVIASRGEWDYNVTQLDTSVRIEVRRVVTDPNSLIGAKELVGKTVSFNFTQPVPVSQMIGIFQDITGLNFVMMPGVTGEIERLKMENTPVETAIDVISRMYSLSMRRFGDLVVVGKAADLAKYEKEERDLKAARLEGEPIEQESIKVRYRPASEIVAALTGAAAASSAAGASNVPAQGSGNQTAQNAGAGAARPLISTRGNISSDPVTNMIFVEETRSQIAKIRERIAVLDQPVRQVMIEARIVSVSTSFSRTLGTKLGFVGVPSAGGINGTINVLSPNSPDGATASGQRVVSGGFNSANGARAGDLQIGLFNSSFTRLISAELYASEADGTAKNIASPKILTQDGRQATITDGQTLFYQLAGGTSGPTTVSVDAATKLDVTPQIGADGKIQLKVNVNKGGVGTVTTNAGPSVTKQEVSTNVVVENGGTLMLGGVFTETNTDSTNQVPLLGDIPVLGWLFKQNDKVKNRSELLIFLTPRIVTEELTLQ